MERGASLGVGERPSRDELRDRDALRWHQHSRLRRAARRRAKARSCHGPVRDLQEQRDGALIGQVLQELFVTITRKMPSPYTLAVARRVIFHYTVWNVVPIDDQLVPDAVDVQEENRLSYWDAAMVAAAPRQRHRASH